MCDELLLFETRKMYLKSFSSDYWCKYEKVNIVTFGYAIHYARTLKNFGGRARMGVSTNIKSKGRETLCAISDMKMHRLQMP